MVSVGLCWARVGTTLGLSWAILGYVGTFWAMLDKSWDHIGLVLGHFGLCWDLLGHVGAMAHLGPFCAIFGFVSAFVLDSGISASLTFRPCKSVQKTPKIPGKIQFVDYVADGFCCYFLVVFVSFLGLQSCWAILGHFRICVGLCFGLGHVSVVDFSSMQGVCKKKQKYQEKNAICIPQWISTTKCYDLGPGK